MIKSHAWTTIVQRVATVTLFGALAFSAESMGAQTAPTIIYACYVPTTGTVYRIKEPKTPVQCTNAKHVEFSWNQQGIQGPQGEAGGAGPAGAQGQQGEPGPIGQTGAAGPSGVSGYQSVSFVFWTGPGVGYKHMYCPDTKFPTGWGFDPGGNYNVAQIAQAFPIYDANRGGYYISVNNTSGGYINVDLYVICASKS